MATRGSRNNLLAGIFVLGSIALAIAVIIVLSDLGERFTPMKQFTVRFSLTDGAEGLRPGSLVKVGGQPVGRVLGWRFALDDAGEPTGVDVEVTVRQDLVLYEDAAALLVVPLLGSNSQINIPDLGDGDVPPELVQGSSPRLEEGEVLMGDLAAPSILAQAGYGEEQRAQVQEILRNMAQATERIGAITARVENELEPTLADVRSVIADAKVISGDVRTKWPEWRDQANTAMANYVAASERIGAVVDSVQAGVADARAIISENQPRIASAVENLEELATKANTQGWDMVRSALERGTEGVDEFAAATARVEGLVREVSPELRTMVANARLASDQLKLTAAEVRAAPWKLLARPTGRRELENEVLYDAARQYAQAVSDLRAASASLESVSQAASGGSGGEPVSAQEQERIDRLLREVEEAFSRYREAERAFLSRLTGPSRGG